MRCLVTGASGFVGRHLVAALLQEGHEVVGVARRPAEVGLPLHTVNLLDIELTEALLQSVRPEWLFHLAGYANAGESFRDPDGAWAGNLEATRGLYTAVTRAGVRPRILYVSSGLVYGDAGPGRQVLKEDTPLRPASPYAVSKAAADLLSYQQSRVGLDIVRVRPFNQIGPGQSPNYAAANFARQIAAAERGDVPPVIVTGDLTGKRDLTDVRDMVQAYMRLLEVGRKGEAYNAGSGRTYVMHDVLMRLIELSRVPVTVEQQTDPSRLGDTAVSRADTTKLRTATGWEPSLNLDQTLAAMLDDWRGR
jgi:GDP-4-dehydro-6-deoxy-D-mannose reductase